MRYVTRRAHVIRNGIMYLEPESILAVMRSSITVKHLIYTNSTRRQNKTTKQNDTTKRNDNIGTEKVNRAYIHETRAMRLGNELIGHDGKDVPRYTRQQSQRFLSVDGARTP